MNRALALRYIAFSVGMLALMRAGWPGTAPLLWPAAGWLWLAAGYAGLGPQVWGKQRSRLKQALLWPVQQVMHWQHRRQGIEQTPVELAPGIWFGGRLDAQAARHHLPPGVAVLDVAVEYPPGWGAQQEAYLALDILDQCAPDALELVVCELFIEMHRERGVYLHGARGNSRVILVAATWLLRRYPRMTVEQALQTLARPGHPLRLSGRQQLALEQVRQLQHECDSRGICP